jgi:hypothetical protein
MSKRYLPQTRAVQSQFLIDLIKQNRILVDLQLTIAGFDRSQLTPVTQAVTLYVQGLAVWLTSRKQQVKSKSLILSKIHLRRSSVRNLL